jgi:hypothetical protein
MYEMGTRADRAMLVVVLPPSVNLADAGGVERAIDQIGEDRIFLTGGAVRPMEPSEAK